jgi:hypothetical protein
LLVVEGRIPPALAPLLERLKALLRAAEDDGSAGR